MWKEKIKEKRFGEFYIPFCEKQSDNGTQLRGSCRMIKIDEDVVALCCYETLKALPVRTLIYEMHKKCEEGELRGETDHQKYEYFKEKFLTRLEILKLFSGEVSGTSALNRIKMQADNTKF